MAESSALSRGLLWNMLLGNSAFILIQLVICICTYIALKKNPDMKKDNLIAIAIINVFAVLIPPRICMIIWNIILLPKIVKRLKQIKENNTVNYCNNCGNAIMADSEFCGICGAKQILETQEE